MNALKTLFLDELADRLDSEKQLVRAMPVMIKIATCDKLKTLIQDHLKETEGHVQKLERVFEAFDEKSKSRKCEATIGLLKEGDELADRLKKSEALNAALISSAQKIEHYEIASYGCLHEWAKILGNQEAAELLEDILEEEKSANEKLIELARCCCNEEALGEDDSTESLLAVEGYSNQ
jgi:ferritin-like metal-binding protein YciE